MATVSALWALIQGVPISSTPIPPPGWLDQFDSFITAHHLANLINVVGLAITVFIALRAKSAANQAKQAANAVRRTISAHGVMVDLTRAMEMIEEIRRHHRTRQWQILPERYSALRQCLRSITSANRSLSDEHRTNLQATMQQVRDIEQKIEEAIAAKSEPANPAKLNRLMGDQIDQLNEILIAIRDSTER
jgi:phosphoglycerate-specific signal transduction histidine kinase